MPIAVVRCMVQHSRDKFSAIVNLPHVAERPLRMQRKTHQGAMPEDAEYTALLDVLRHRHNDDCHPNDQWGTPGRELATQRRPQSAFDFASVQPQNKYQHDNDEKIAGAASLEHNGEEQGTLDEERQQIRDFELSPGIVGRLDD